MMTVITNHRELPTEALRASVVTGRADAEKKAEGYKEAWYFERGKFCTLYVRDAEWWEKHQVDSGQLTVGGQGRSE